jgi:branched-chain amino acid aminotransferase
MRPLRYDLYDDSFFGVLANTNDLKIGIRDGVSGDFQLVPRNEAKVSVFDSNFLIGDGIWVSCISTSGVFHDY